MTSSTPLSGRFFELKGVEPSDYVAIASLATSERLDVSWRADRVHGLSTADFQARLVRDVIAHFTVVRRSTGTFVGYVSAYRYDARARSSYVLVALSDRYQGMGIGIEAVASFLDYLFSTWQLTKVYFEADAGRAVRFEHLVRRLGRREACLRSYAADESGGALDRAIYATYRADWERFPRRRRRALASGVPTHEHAAMSPRPDSAQQTFSDEPSGALSELATIEAVDAVVTSWRLHLVPVEERGLRFLYQLSRLQESDFRWRFRNGCTSLEAFALAMASDDVITHRLVVASENGRPIGFIGAYTPDRRVGRCWLAVSILDSYAATGIGAEAIAAFAHAELRRLGFTRCFLELPAPTARSLLGAPSQYFALAGRLGHDVVHDGAVVDSVILEMKV